MRKRMKIRIVTNKKDCNKYSSRPTFENFIIFGKNLAAIHEKPLQYQKKPNQRCTHFDMIFWRKCSKVELVYMDPDSFIFEVTNQNFNDNVQA